MMSLLLKAVVFIFIVTLLPKQSYSQDTFLKKLPVNQPNGYNIEKPSLNPFGFISSIKLSNPDSSYINCIVYSPDGEVIRNLYEGYLGIGVYEIMWNLKNNNGDVIKKSGIYLVRIAITTVDIKSSSVSIELNATVKLPIYF